VCLPVCLYVKVMWQCCVVLKKVLVVCGMIVILFRMPCAELSQFICLEDTWNTVASQSRNKLVFLEYLKLLADLLFFAVI
jgi:hypothetical protein